MLIYALLAVALAVGCYLLLNGKRNSDPLNRKCAAEICEYVAGPGDISIEGIRDIFMRNARYKKQANHVVSMVPVLLIKAGYPKDVAMGVVPLLREAASEVPH